MGVCRYVGWSIGVCRYEECVSAGMGAGVWEYVGMKNGSYVVFTTVMQCSAHTGRRWLSQTTTSP